MMEDDLFFPDKEIMVKNPGNKSPDEAAQMLHDMYMSLIKAGFNKSQALTLVCQMLSAANSGR